MADEKTLAKVTVVYRIKQKVPKPSGKVYEYFCWTGYYREEGRRKHVYLGRELPERFKDLVVKRVRSPQGWKLVAPRADQISGR